VGSVATVSPAEKIRKPLFVLTKRNEFLSKQNVIAFQSEFSFDRLLLFAPIRCIEQIESSTLRINFLEKEGDAWEKETSNQEEDGESIEKALSDAWPAEGFRGSTESKGR
jgi:hypothetical protein